MDRFDASDTFLAERQVVHFRDQRRNSTNRNTSDSSDLDRRTDEAERLLRRIATHHVPAVFASSFGAEDMVLIDMIARNALRIRLFTLDTGRLPEETHTLIERTRERYALPVDIFTPDARLLQTFVRENGVNAFYRSTELRKSCCAVRKTEPLKRALVAKGAWITGLRRAQAVTRQNVPLEEFDAVHGLPKFNPLAEWGDDDVWSYLRTYNVPYNALHDRGFPSIGCAPCTRAVKAGEDIRAIRGGHIPGATNIPYEQNWIDPETPGKLARKQVSSNAGMSLKSMDDLKRLYSKLDPSKETIVYCQSGVRASETAGVLQHLGFTNVKVYDSSWLGYGNTLDAPAENVTFFNVGLLNSRISTLQERINQLEKELAETKARK